MPLRPFLRSSLSAARAASAAAAFGTASGWALAHSGSIDGVTTRRVSAENVAAGAKEGSKRAVVGRYCMDLGSVKASAPNPAKPGVEDKVPMGQVLSVVECKPGSVMEYRMMSESASMTQVAEAQPPAVECKGKVCFDYAVVLTGRIEQYLAKGQSFPATAGPGSFLTHDATLHNSWQVPCHIALVRL